MSFGEIPLSFISSSVQLYSYFDHLIICPNYLMQIGEILQNDISTVLMETNNSSDMVNEVQNFIKNNCLSLCAKRLSLSLLCYITSSFVTLIHRCTILFMESLNPRLEKILKVIESNCKPNTTKSDTKLCPYFSFLLSHCFSMTGLSSRAVVTALCTTVVQKK